LEAHARDQADPELAVKTCRSKGPRLLWGNPGLGFSLPAPHAQEEAQAMTLYTWSKTPSNNTTADATINWAEGQSPSSVNDSARASMAAVAKFRDDNNGADLRHAGRGAVSGCKNGRRRRRSGDQCRDERQRYDVGHGRRYVAGGPRQRRHERQWRGWRRWDRWNQRNRDSNSAHCRVKRRFLNIDQHCGANYRR
jgi:hypothetical protein